MLEDVGSLQVGVTRGRGFGSEGGDEMVRRTDNGSEVVAGDGLPMVDIEDSPLTADSVGRLSSAARHRIAAFVHTTLADLDELPEPWVPPIEVTLRMTDRDH